jgi:hypothetical protein
VILLAILVGVKLLAATCVGVIGVAIVMELRGAWRPHQPLAILASLALSVMLAIIVVEAVATLRPAVAGATATFMDRIVVFDRLANGHLGGANPGLKVFQSCGYAILSQTKRHPHRSEGNDDYPSAALSLLP